MAGGLAVGIDVQLSRGCALVALDLEGRSLGARWARGESIDAIVEACAATLAAFEERAGAPALVGVDAPRRPLPAPREHYWEGAQGRWRRRRPSDRGLGRHAEVVVSALGLARPQWTPLEAEAPAWMRLGFELFARLGDTGRGLYEVFPSAALRCLAGDEALRVEHGFAGFAEGPKDVLDALVAAASVLAACRGGGVEVGGGDGLGTILLPRLDPALGAHPVHRWPGVDD